MVASPDGLRSGRAPRPRKGRRDLVLTQHAAAGLHHAAQQYLIGDRQAAADREPTSSSPRSRRRRRTSPAGCARRSSPRWAWAAACRRGRRVPRVLRRAEDPHHARPRAPARGRAGDLRRAARPARACPSASLVAIDNKTGEVRAMVGGPIVNGSEDYAHHPFNLATEGHRQPGSAFKPFTLVDGARVAASRPTRCSPPRPPDFIVPNSGGKEHFIVHNFGDTYSGHDHARPGDRRLGQLGLRAAGHSGPRQDRDQADRRIWPGRWGSARRCRATTR